MSQMSEIKEKNQMKRYDDSSLRIDMIGAIFHFSLTLNEDVLLDGGGLRIIER